MTRSGSDRGGVAREPAEPVEQADPRDEDQVLVEDVVEAGDGGAASDAAQAAEGEPQVLGQQQEGPNQMEQVLGLLAQILDRLPRPVAALAPKAPLEASEPPRMENPEYKVANSENQVKKSLTLGSGKNGRLEKGQKRKWKSTSKNASSGQSGCYGCGSEGHWIANCPNGDTRMCYRCKEVGHIKILCPKLQQGGRGSKAPPPKRAAVTPPAYSSNIESGEPSNSKPTNG